MFTVIEGRKLYHHDDYLGRTLAKKEDYYERDFLDYSTRNQRKGIIMDIGANIGNHTSFWIMRNEKVRAYEPSIDSAKLLMFNIKERRLYGCKSTVLVDALSNIEYPYTMAISDENRGADVVVPSGTSDAKTCLLDNIAPSNENIKLIKIDVEGMELEVLQGAFLTIMRHLPDLMVEINDTKTLRYLKYLGYVKKYGRKGSTTIYFVHKNNADDNCYTDSI